MKNQLLLLEDVGRLGRKGDIVKAKPGFARNFLLPQKKAMVATQHTLRLRERLQAEREKQAAKSVKISLLQMSLFQTPSLNAFTALTTNESSNLFKDT